jgi:hypothetical protein
MNAIDCGVVCEIGSREIRGAAETVKDGFSQKPHVKLETFAVSSNPETERRQGLAQSGVPSI